MAKKKQGLGFASRVQGLIEAAAGSLESWFGLLGERFFRKLIQKYAMIIVLALSALIITLNGVSLLIGSYFPSWRPGVSHIVTGIIFAGVGFAYLRNLLDWR